jgi:hypothetical protein
MVMRRSARIAILAILIAGLAIVSHAVPRHVGSSAAVAQAPLSPVIVGQEGGSAKAVAVHGDRALLGIGPCLMMLDVSDPRSPREVWRSEVLPAVVAGVAVSGDFAYAVYGHDLLTLDLSVPDHPQALGHLYLYVTDTAAGVVVSAGYAYVVLNALSPEGVAIVDVRDPRHPRQVGTAPWFAVNAHDLAVAGTYAYVVAGDLSIIDVSNPEQPRVVSQVDLGTYGFCVAAAGNHAFVTSASTLFVIDVSDHLRPEIVGALPLGGVRIAVDGSRAYVGGETEGLSVVDVADPRHPALVTAVPVPGSAADIAVDRGRVFLATPGVGLRVLIDHCGWIRCLVGRL